MKSILLGSNYLKTKNNLSETEFLSKDKIQEFQKLKLHKLLIYALEKIPFYKKNVSHAFNNYEDPFILLKKFPIINKKIINTQLHEFLLNSFFRKMKVTTGGSTGEPFCFYMDRFVTRQKEKGFIHDQWKRVGYKFGDPIFNLRGRTPSSNKFVHHDCFFNIFYASSFNLNKSSLHEYISAINRIKPKFIHGYPSTIYQLSILMKSTKQKLDFQPIAVFCGSEKFYDYQRKLIESVFGCQAYHWYGHSECLALGGECEFSNKFHFYPQYGYTELLPTGIFNDNGRELHEIVATGFNNRIMPLIRYRTGDYAIISKNQKCQCGRNYLIVDEIIGRQQEFVIDKNLNPISVTSLIFGQHYPSFSGIENIKIIQEKPGTIEIQIVKNIKFNSNDFNFMKKKISQLLDDKILTTFSFVDYLEKSPLGKSNLVKQHLDIENYFSI